MIRLLADANTSHAFVKACLRLHSSFPIAHIADWQNGRYRMSPDPVLLSVLREHQLILVSFDRRTLPMHAAQLTREDLGHAGLILFRRSVAQLDYGKQSRLLVSFWNHQKDLDWVDRIQYLPE